MSKNDELTKGEKDLAFKILAASIGRLKKIEAKAQKDGDEKIASAARSQQAEVEALQTKLL